MLMNVLYEIKTDIEVIGLAIEITVKNLLDEIIGI